MFRLLFYTSVLLICFEAAFAQTKVTFLSEDSLKITADLYLKDYTFPFIILFHQEGSSRGEFADVAAKLMKMDYNCLAVNLRCGRKSNYILNETAARAKDGKLSQKNLDAWKDVKSSLAYVKKISDKPVILFGSSFSASLALLEAAVNPDILAVVAFSPGEYFMPDLSVEDAAGKVRVPVFVYASVNESTFVKQMLRSVPGGVIHLFSPGKENNLHGTRILKDGGEASSECWLELLLFFKQIRQF